jgi:hypothetical protein
MRQERLDLGPAHLLRMALAVKVDGAAHPVQLRVLGAQAVVPHPQSLTILLEQLRLRHAPSFSCAYT